MIIVHNVFTQLFSDLCYDVIVLEIIQVIGNITCEKPAWDGKQMAM